MEKWDYLNARYFPYFLRPGLEMLAAYRNHPSILFWSLANESKWSPLWAKVLQVFKRYEQTRPCAFHDQCWGGFNNAHSKADIANYHYPSENNSDAWSKKAGPSGLENTPICSATTAVNWRRTPEYRKTGAARCNAWWI